LTEKRTDHIPLGGDPPRALRSRSRETRYVPSPPATWCPPAMARCDAVAPVCDVLHGGPGYLPPSTSSRALLPLLQKNHPGDGRRRATTAAPRSRLECRCPLSRAGQLSHDLNFRAEGGAAPPLDEMPPTPPSLSAPWWCTPTRRPPRTLPREVKTRAPIGGPRLARHRAVRWTRRSATVPVTQRGPAPFPRGLPRSQRRQPPKKSSTRPRALVRPATAMKASKQVT